MQHQQLYIYASSAFEKSQNIPHQHLTQLTAPTLNAVVAFGSYCSFTRVDKHCWAVNFDFTLFSITCTIRP